MAASVEEGADYYARDSVRKLTQEYPCRSFDGLRVGPDPLPYSNLLENRPAGSHPTQLIPREVLTRHELTHFHIRIHT